MANGVFPSRNLGAGENWGRNVEQEIKQSRNKESEIESRLASVNRSIAGNLNRITGLESYTTRSAHYASIVEGFGIKPYTTAPQGYDTIIALEIPGVEGFPQAHLQVSVLMFGYPISSAHEEMTYYSFVEVGWNPATLTPLTYIPVTLTGGRAVRGTPSGLSTQRAVQASYTGGALVEIPPGGITLTLVASPFIMTNDDEWFPPDSRNNASLDVLATYYPDPDTRV